MKSTTWLISYALPGAFRSQLIHKLFTQFSVTTFRIETSRSRRCSRPLARFSYADPVMCRTLSTPTQWCVARSVRRTRDVSQRLKWYGQIKRRDEWHVLRRMSDAPIPGEEDRKPDGTARVNAIWKVCG